MKESFSEKGGWWVVLQFALMASILASGPFLGNNWSGPWSPIIGALLMLAGAGVGIAGAWTLGKNRTAYPAPKADSQLIQHGIYGYIRHPLYTSLILLGLGWALSWHSGVALIATATMAVHLHLKAKFEERRLEQLFPDYPAYRERVPPFFPRIR